jgi:hypothetical protein
VAAPQLVFLNPSAGGAGIPGFEVLRCWASQRANATSAQQGMRLGTKITAFPTLVSATPAKLGGLGIRRRTLVGNTTGAAGTAGINSSANGGGTEIGVYPDNFNVLNGWLWCRHAARDDDVHAGRHVWILRPVHEHAEHAHGLVVGYVLPRNRLNRRRTDRAAMLPPHGGPFGA